MKPVIKILGNKENNKKTKPIEVLKVLDSDALWSENHCFNDLSDLKYITLICKDYTEDHLDLFLIHDNPCPSCDPENTVLCLGWWNDGIIRK